VDAYFVTGSEVSIRPFALLGLGLTGEDAPDRKLVLDVLHAEVANASGPAADREAAVIALGLSGDRGDRTVRALSKIAGDDLLRSRIRGRAAVALALLGRKEAAEPWALAQVRTATDAEAIRDAAAALAILGNAEVAGILLERLEAPETKPPLALALLRALGDL
jgi:hypothetical protein